MVKGIVQIPPLLLIKSLSGCCAAKQLGRQRSLTVWGTVSRNQPTFPEGALSLRLIVSLTRLLFPFW